ncbi:MAG: hypothetical protein HY438_00675 [DPANN group archaeon]|nr:hypothetical protein [DPANN group archaeon]
MAIKKAFKCCRHSKTEMQDSKYRNSFLAGLERLLVAMPQVENGRLAWALAGSASWCSVVCASAIERLAREKLPAILPEQIYLKSEIFWEEILPRRKIKDFDIIRYRDSKKTIDVVDVSGLDAAFARPAAFIDEGKAIIGFGNPVRCTIEYAGREIEVYTDAPEANLAHKVIRAMDNNERKNQSHKAMRDLRAMESVAPLMNAGIFLEYLLDAGCPPNNLFEHIKKCGWNMNRFEHLPEVWQEFIENVMMHPDGPGQQIANLIGIMDMPLSQRFEYFSVFTYYTQNPQFHVPAIDLARYLQDCHRENEEIDFALLDTWASG